MSCGKIDIFVANAYYRSGQIILIEHKYCAALTIREDNCVALIGLDYSVEESQDEVRVEFLKSFKFKEFNYLKRT